MWDTITQAWIVPDNMQKTHTFSSYLLENIRTLIKYRVLIVLQRPVRKEHIGLYQRQVYFYSEEGYGYIAFH